MPYSQQDLHRIVGDPEQVSSSLRTFRESAQVLSSEEPRMIDAYPRQWIGIYQGAVAAHADTLAEVMEQIDQLALPRENVLTRFIDENHCTMIL